MLGTANVQPLGKSVCELLVARLHRKHWVLATCKLVYNLKLVGIFSTRLLGLNYYCLSDIDPILLAKNGKPFGVLRF